ncbi:tetratricopeptide repeat protein [Dactylosporangium sp. NPDC048998]|uniref:tetratricopeptide repeat protein n=1 Tax=Dactylosporangium sp. NPDC048998 TaxID=3363976 RepID=UPI0037200D06
MRFAGVRRMVRGWWARARGWWLISGAAAVAALVSAAGHRYSGLGASLVVAVVGAIAGVVADRGRTRLASGAAGAGLGTTVPAIARVDRLTDPIRMGVHRAEALDSTPDRVPPFVPRDRLPQVEAALREGGFLLVTGDSTAGKTRLVFEAMRRTLPGHVCVDPRGPDGLAAAVTAARRHRPSVLWLDDLERYLGQGGLTQTVVGDLLDVPGDVVILATIRAHERDALSHRYDAERPTTERPMARAGREVLAAVTHEVRLERLWSHDELTRAGEFRHDPRIARALDGAHRHGVAERLAAGPRLLDALHDAWAVGPRTRAAALVTAAVDVRRTGYHRPFPLDRLRALHEHYLLELGGPALRPGPWQAALDWATQPLYGTSSLLEPASGAGYLAFDYLVDAAARDPDARPVPEYTWLAVMDHAEPRDLVEVVWQASYAGLPDLAVPAFDKALAARAYDAAAAIAYCLGEAGREDEAVARFEAVLAAAREDASADPLRLLQMRLDLAWQLGEKVAGQGQPERALQLLRDAAREAETLLGSDHATTLDAQRLLARQLGAVGEPEAALALAADVAGRAREQLGTRHHDYWSARFEVAIWTSEVHGPGAGSAVFQKLAVDAEACDPVPWALLADCWWNLAGCLLDTGEPTAARDAARRAVEASARTYGPAHVRTLRKRETLVDAVGVSGDAVLAGQLAAELLADSIHALGETHPITLAARATTERWP